MDEASELAGRYFDAWQARDEQALGEILAEDVTFRGPLGTANGRSDCIAGLMGMLGIVTGIEVQARVADEHDVITWFDLHTTAAAPAPTANWSHVENGRITRIRVAFDPRDILRGPLRSSMRAVRLHTPGGPEHLVVEQVDTPSLRTGDALVRVRAAAITRDELSWPVDRLPAIPSYELSGVIDAVAPGVTELTVGQAVYGLTPFDRDGAAAQYAAVPATALAPRPTTLDDVHAAALPLSALSAWQGLFDHGGLTAGQRLLIHGGAGGVGHLAVQLARRHGAHVIATASADSAEDVHRSGAHEVLDPDRFEETLEPVDLVFDTVGGQLLARSAAILRPGGTIVSIAEESEIGTYFVVEPNREQLAELTRLVDAGQLRVEVDSVFPLDAAPSAFARSMQRGKRGKVILHVEE